MFLNDNKIRLKYNLLCFFKHTLRAEIYFDANQPAVSCNITCQEIQIPVIAKNKYVEVIERWAMGCKSFEYNLTLLIEKKQSQLQEVDRLKTHNK